MSETARLSVTRDVTPDECHWLKSTVEAGTIVYRYFGYTYGCIGSGMAVTREEGKTPFFELPRDAIAALSPDNSTQKKEGEI